MNFPRPVQIIQANSCASCVAMYREGQAMQCRLNPPTVTAIIAPGPRGPVHVGSVSTFPNVEANMSCRQYKRSVIVDDRLSGAVVEGAA